MDPLIFENNQTIDNITLKLNQTLEQMISRNPNQSFVTIIISTFFSLVLASKKKVRLLLSIILSFLKFF